MTTNSGSNAVIASVLASIAGQFESATPNAGMGSLGEWPPEGNHDCFLTGMTVDLINDKDPARGTTIPGFSVQFEYRVIGDPNNASPLEWKGAPFRLFQNGTDAFSDEKRKTVIRMETERLKNHLQIILGRPVPGTALQEAIGEVQAILSGGALRAFDVYCQYRQGKGDKSNRTYKTEYIHKALSTTATAATT